VRGGVPSMWEYDPESNPHAALCAADPYRCAKFRNNRAWFDRVNEVNKRTVSMSQFNGFHARLTSLRFPKNRLGVILPQSKTGFSAVERVDVLGLASSRKEGDLKEDRT